MKTTECTPTQYAETELKRYRVLSKYSIQELEDLILASGKGHALEFLKHFRDFKGGLLTQIHSSLSNRAKSQLAKGPKFNRGLSNASGVGNEDEESIPSIHKQAGICAYQNGPIKKYTFYGGMSTKNMGVQRRLGTAGLGNSYRASNKLMVRNTKMKAIKENTQAGQKQVSLKRAEKTNGFNMISF